MLYNDKIITMLTAIIALLVFISGSSGQTTGGGITIEPEVGGLKNSTSSFTQKHVESFESLQIGQQTDLERPVAAPLDFSVTYKTLFIEQNKAQGKDVLGFRIFCFTS